MAFLNREIINITSLNACDISFSGPIDFSTNSPSDSTGWRISIAVLQFFLGLFDLSIVLYLSLLLKKRAWDSPAKRFGHFFNLYLALTFLVFAIVNFSTTSKLTYSVAIRIAHYPFIVGFLNFAALLVALSLQLVAPFLPERVKKQCESRPRCVWFIEGIFHVLFILLIISNAPFFYCSSSCVCTDYNLIILFIGATSFSNIILFLSFTILVFTYIKFFRNPNINKSIKFVILKLAFVIVICMLFTISIVFVKNKSVVRLLHIIFNIFFTLSVVSLNFPLHVIWCLRNTPRHASLLPINDTDRQQTNPLSVWDHRNVPSSTETNLPFEMSDGRSDYIFNSFSVLTPSVH